MYIFYTIKYYTPCFIEYKAKNNILHKIYRLLIAEKQQKSVDGGLHLLRYAMYLRIKTIVLGPTFSIWKL
jgi:hypothetical protein